MRSVALALALLMVPSLGHATAQEHDTMLIAGERHQVLSHIPDPPRIKSSNPLPPYIGFSGRCSGNWRGYRVIWKLDGDRLILSGVAKPCSQEPHDVQPFLEGSALKSLPADATWFTGDVRVGDGKWCAGFVNPTLERTMRLRFDNGILTARNVENSACPALPRTPVNVPAFPRQTVRALVVGNGAYEHLGRLGTPANDARAIAKLLRDMGIEVDLVLDADREVMARALREHERKTSDKDVGLFFYAGHAVQVDGTNYLIPTNMQSSRMPANQVKLDAMALETVLASMRSKIRLVFLDACRDNPLAQALAATGPAPSAGLARVAGGRDTLIAFATKDGGIVAEAAGEHSPFTAALLQYLPFPNDISIVLRMVRASVLRSTVGRQEPWEYGYLSGGALVLSQIAR